MMGRLDTTKVNFYFFIMLPKSDVDFGNRLVNPLSDLSNLYTWDTKEKLDKATL